MQIRDVTGQLGEPGSTVLANVTLPASSVTSGFNSVSFPPVAVQAGTQYALVAFSAQPASAFPDAYEWSKADTPDPYAGGQLLISLASPPTTWGFSGDDLAFRTYVVTTGPSGPTGPTARPVPPHHPRTDRRRPDPLALQARSEERADRPSRPDRATRKQRRQRRHRTRWVDRHNRPPGPPGSSGVSGYVQVVGAATATNGRDRKTATATCPSDKKVFGGGYQISPKSPKDNGSIIAVKDSLRPRHLVGDRR